MKNAVLERAVIQRQFRGVSPSRHITAPDNVVRANLLEERERLAYFAQSEATRNRLPAHPPVPRERALVPVQETKQ